MEGVAWTAITLLGAAVFGMLFYLGSRIESLAGKIDAQGADLGARIDAQTGRIDAQTARIDALVGQVSDHIAHHSG